jgi:predicted esterase
MRTLAPTILAALAFAAPASAKQPDLRVASGTTQVSGTAVSGSFVVRNAGGRRAAPTTAVLRIGSSRVLGSVPVKAIKPGARRTVNLTGGLPSGLAPKTYTLTACADAGKVVRERKEGNNCRAIGTADVIGAPTPAGPIVLEPGSPVQLQSGQSSYWAIAGDDQTQAPMPLLVWLHGCGGDSGGDIYTVAPTDSLAYVAIAVGGRDGECWKVDEDTGKVLAAIDNAETHFDVDPRRVIIGGYSSGGDLAYRTAFYNAPRFAGLLAVNTAPFQDTGSTQSESLAAATSKFHIVHLAHTEDDTYAIDDVRRETDALKAAGFDIQRIERPGGHSDDHTDPDTQQLLLPHMADGWTSP